MTRQTLIQATGVSKSIGGKDLFRDISFSLMEDSRAAIIGINGSGKSTLFKLIAGEELADRGHISKRKGLVVEYVPQSLPKELRELSLLESMERKASASDRDVPEWRIGYLVGMLGLREADLQKKMSMLSGGEVNRALLARALLVEPDFLLLDEPTNHLDSEGIVKFEALLRDRLETPFCIISHDRELIDRNTNQTLILRDETLHQFPLSYSLARLELQKLDEAAAHQRKMEEKEIARLERATQRLHQWAHISADMAPRYRAMQTRLSKAKTNLTFVSKAKARALGVGMESVRADAIITFDKVDVTVGSGRKLYSIDDIAIAPGERIALLGRNGSGKSTLIRTLVQAFERDKVAGIRVNPRAVLGYYDQELKDLPLDRSLIDFIAEASKVSNQRAHGELVAAGFPYADHGRLIESLSGGERARMKFLSLKLRSTNILLLDEPTNHLDVQGIERLEDELISTSGTVLFVSHDRRFVANVATRFLLIHEGKLREIDSPDPYYALLEEDEPTTTPVFKASDTSADAVMARIETLEEKLRSHSIRGAQLTTARAELDTLYQKLENLLR